MAGTETGTEIGEETNEVRRARRLTHYINRAHLLYLGFLPILATSAAIGAYGVAQAWMWVIFLGGVAAVGVYLAVVLSYTPRPQHWLWALVLFLDGPLAILLSLDRPLPLSLAIESFLVDGLAVWLAIFGLSLTSSLPTPGQRAGSVFFMVAAVASMVALFWPYFREVLLVDTGRLFWLGLILLEGMVVRTLVLQRGSVKSTAKDDDFGILFIALLVMAWCLSLFAGSAIFEASLR